MSDSAKCFVDNGGVDLQNGGAQSQGGKALFGMTTLMTKDGLKSVDEVLAGKTSIGIYFSAHWCPPCRQFTPILSAFYKAAQREDFEIIFLSSDRDQAAFDGYYAEMPWVALPYEQREKKNEIAEMFEVSGIPAFKILDSDGNVKSLEGRGDIMQCVGNVMRARFGDKKESEITEDDVKLEFSDAEAENFKKQITSWIDREIYVKPEFFGVTKVQDGDEVKDIAEVKENSKAIAWYFSASWCGPCRSFTPKLIEFYNVTRDSGLEIIFVGLDRTEEEHNKYFEKMPWKAIPYGDDSRENLTKDFSIRGIPHLAITKLDGTIVETQGVDMIRQAVDGAAMQALATMFVADCQ